MKNWIYNVLIGIDQLANALVGGNPDETISSRTARSSSRFGRAVKSFLNIFERDHSRKAHEYTPWGTANPHNMLPVHPEIAADWNALIAVMRSERDLDGWPLATLDAAQRALERLHAWQGREKWKARLERDLEVGDLFQP